MARIRKIVCLTVVILMLLFPFAVYAEGESKPEENTVSNETGNLDVSLPEITETKIGEDAAYQATVNVAVEGEAPQKATAEIKISGYYFEGGEKDSKPFKTETKKVELEKSNKVTVEFDKEKIAKGSVCYDISMKSASKGLVIDNRTITVYIRSAELVTLADEKAADPELREIDFDVDPNIGVKLDVITFTCKIAKPVTVTAVKDKTFTKEYDGTPNVELTSEYYTVSGLDDGDKVTVKSDKAVFNSSNVKDATKVTVTEMTLSGTNASKYYVSTAKIEFPGKITPKAITVTADDKVMSREDSDPELTYTLSSPLCGQDKAIGELTRASGNESGVYPITRGTLSFGDNYDITFVEGKFIISNFNDTMIKDPDTGITVNGFFDPTVTVEAKVLKPESDAYKLIKSYSNFVGNVVASYDVVLSSDVHDGSYTVTFPVPSKYDGKQFYVYQLAEGRKLEAFKTGAVDGKVAVVTNECSQFILLTDAGTVKKSGGSFWKTFFKVILIIILVLLVIVLILGLIFFGMIFFNKTEQLKKIVRLFKKNRKKRRR